MRTTIDIDDPILKEVKRLQAQQGKSLGRLVSDLLAQSLGCFGVKVDAIEELGPALQAAVQSGKPAVIHVAVDAAVNADPIGFKEFRYARTL